jgi:hypothetical protein
MGTRVNRRRRQWTACGTGVGFALVMHRWVSITPVLLIVLFTAGCGYVMAGTWEDDSGNWNRAFQSTRPPDVAVTHSKYWRSPHWTYEFQYFFEIAPNQPLRDQLFTSNKMRQVTGDEATRIRTDVFGNAPPWFAPKGATEYHVWVLEGEGGRHFKVLIDRQSGVMFLNDYQV